MCSVSEQISTDATDLTISPAKARRVVRRAAQTLGCTVKELKRAVAGTSVIPSSLIQHCLREAADEFGCTVDDVRLAIIDDGTERGKITPSEARAIYAIVHSVERVALSKGVSLAAAREALTRPERRGRRPKPHDPAERARLLKLLSKHGSTRLAAEACGLSQTTFLRRIKDPVRER